jgi:hypothetical protein
MRRFVVVAFVAALFGPSIAAAFVAKPVASDGSPVLMAEAKKKEKLKPKPKPKAEEKKKAAPGGYQP